MLVTPKAEPNELLLKIEVVSVLAAEPPKIFAGGDCATGFISGEQIFWPCKTESTLDNGVIVTDDVTAFSGFDKSTGAAEDVIVAPKFANENLTG